MENKPKAKSLTKFIIFSISMVILYTITVTILSTLCAFDYSTYYVTFCSIFGGEILSCALIKVFKLKKGE